MKRIRKEAILRQLRSAKERIGNHYSFDWLCEIIDCISQSTFEIIAPRFFIMSDGSGRYIGMCTLEFKKLNVYVYCNDILGTIFVGGSSYAPDKETRSIEEAKLLVRKFIEEKLYGLEI